MLPENTLITNLQNHLDQIARERDPYLASAGHFFVQNYIQAQFSQWGKVESHEFSLQAKGRVHNNFVLNLPAINRSNSRKGMLLIGAHYDAVPGTPGADDNASGVAVMLELARYFATHPARHPIRLVAFDLEEYGMVGSTAYANEVWQTHEPIRLMLSLEMLGYFCTTPNSQIYPSGLQYFYPNIGDFIALVGNLTALPDMLALSHHLRTAGMPCQWLPALDKGRFLAATRLSDHAPFWNRGYRAMMVTDTAFLRNPNYHKPSDQVGTLDLRKMASVCEGLAHGLRCL